jgi:GH15 family glucan-1,4-alpha-glucosidase
MSPEETRTNVPNYDVSSSGDGQFTKLLERSVSRILANQVPSGAIVASSDFTQYHFSWLRDGSFIAYALDVAGEHEAAERYHRWVSDAVANIGSIIDDVIDQRRMGGDVDPLRMPPARFSVEGTTVVDGWPNFQIDGYGTWLWSLGEHMAITGATSMSDDLRSSVERVARYLTTFAMDPCYDVWEESGTAVHTSTLASVYGGLLSAGRLLNDVVLLDSAETVRARVFNDAVKSGIYVKSTENHDVDASTLWLLAPFCLVSDNDSNFIRTVDAIESRLGFDGGIRRYPQDTYFGSGAWPVLTASLGWHKLVTGDLEGARRCRDWITDRFDELGRLGEQFGGERRDPKHFAEWVERWGLPAQDLTWSHAMYVVLTVAIQRHEDSNLANAYVSSLDRKSMKSEEWL